MGKLLTAKQARELSGIDSELRKIDEDILSQATMGFRVSGVRTDVLLESDSDSILLRIRTSLEGRGFSVEQKENPRKITVSW